MKGEKLIIILLILVFGGFSAACNGNGDDADADADVQQEDMPAEAEADTPVDVPPDEAVDDMPSEVEPDPVEDPVEDSIEDSPADMTELPETWELSGRVWHYYPALYTYSADPMGGATVRAESGLIDPEDFTVTTATDDCGMWWNLGEPFDCGTFTISGLPTYYESALLGLVFRASPPGETGPDTLSRVIYASDNSHQVIVLVQQELIDGLLGEWEITQDSDKAMMVGILVETVNPDPIYEMGNDEACPATEAACELSGFVGSATVAFTGTGLSDLDVIYLSSEDYTDTSRTDTDPAQSLFFVPNVPVAAPVEVNTVSVTSSTHTFADRQFLVEAGTITYLLLVADPE